MPATITVETPDENSHELTAEEGAILRDVLLAAGRYTRRVSCGGRGICATCGVRLTDPIDPEHWHDELPDRFGYSRLSCQIRVRDEMVVELLDKRAWGGRE